MRRGLALLVLAGLVGLACASARAQEVVLGLSDEVIAVGPRFAGTQLLVFGATDRPGDLVIVLRGPETPVAVRRKDRLAGIWINRESMLFASVPRFYALASTRPLKILAAPEVLAEARLGIEHLNFWTVSVQSEERIAEFRGALIALEREVRHYGGAAKDVAYLAERLFRASFDLPATVPAGTYTVEAYLFQKGTIVARAAKSFLVQQTGFGAAMQDFAHRRPIAYGFIALSVALMAGWLGGFLFRKRARR